MMISRKMEMTNTFRQFLSYLRIIFHIALNQTPTSFCYFFGKIEFIITLQQQQTIIEKKRFSEIEN